MLSLTIFGLACVALVTLAHLLISWKKNIKFDEHFFLYVDSPIIERPRSIRLEPATSEYHCVAHASFFVRAGDYINLSIAGYGVVLVKGNDGVIRGHLNICRHRAHAIVNRPCGNSQVMVCPYHGWTYNLKGDLVSGPRFNSVEGFDKTKNSLWGVDVATDRTSGLIFVKLDKSPSKKGPVWQSLRWDHLAGLSLVKTFDYADRHFNWKLIHLLKGASGQNRLLRPKPRLDIVHVCETSVLIIEAGLQAHLLLSLLPQSPEQTHVRAHLFRDPKGSTSHLHDQVTALIETRLEQLSRELEREQARIRDCAISTLKIQSVGTSGWETDAYMKALNDPTPKAAHVGQVEDSEQWAQDQELLRKIERGLQMGSSARAFGADLSW